MSLLWGIDLGGTKIEGVVLPEAGSTAPLVRLRVPTESADGYSHILGQIQKLIDQLSAEVGEKPTRIGMGTPGVTDPTSGRLKNSNTVCLNGMPLQRDLIEKTNIEFILANDANCFALAEATLGAGRGFSTAFGVIMGTGVGGGVVVNGQALNGGQGIAGEWGHNVLIPDGELCYCGKHGCVETVLSGPALQRWHTRHSGEALSLAEVVEQAKAGSDRAQKTLDHLYEQFGRALSVVVNILDPHVIILGGGVSNVPGLIEFGSQSLTKHVFNDHLGTQIRLAELGDSAGVFGAAMLTAG